MSVYKESYETHKQDFLNIAKEYDNSDEAFYRRILSKGKNKNSDESSEKDWKDIQNKFIQVYDKWKLHFEFDTENLQINDDRMLTEKGCWKDGKYPKDLNEIYLLRSFIYMIFELLFKWINYFENEFFTNHKHNQLESNITACFSLLKEFIIDKGDYKTIENFINRDFFYDLNANDIMKYNFENGKLYADRILELLQFIDKFFHSSEDLIKDIELIQKKFIEVNNYYILKCYGGNPSGISIFNEKASWKEYLLPTDFMIDILRANFHFIFDQLFKWTNIPEIEEFILKDYFSLNSYAFHTSTFVNMRLIGKFIMGYKNPLKVENDWYQAIKNFIETNEETEEYLNTIKHNMNNGSCYKDNILIALYRIHEIFIEYNKYYNDVKGKTIPGIETRDDFFAKLNDEQKQERHKKHIAQLSEKAHNPSEFQDSVLNFNDESNLKNLQERFFDEGYKLILGGSHVISNSTQLKKIGGFLIGNPIVVFPSKEKGEIKMDHFPIWTFLSFIDKNSTRKASEIFGESPLSPMEEYKKFLKL